VDNTKVVLERTLLPIKDELKPLFPTLLASGAEGMQQLSIKVDNVNGTLLKSDTPLIVSALAVDSVDWMRALRRTGCWWTQCDHGPL